METRRKLLEAAEKCLLERGSHAASVKTIAAMANVNHGLVHHYFGSKEGLFIELAKELLKRTTPPQSLDLEKDIVSFLKETVVINSKMMIELRALAFHMPELSNVLVSILSERRSNIQRILHIDQNKANLLIATVAGLGFQSSLDTSMDLEDCLLKIFKLIIEEPVKNTPDPPPEPSAAGHYEQEI